MDEITFSDEILEGLSDKVVFITGRRLLPLQSSHTNKPGGHRELEERQQNNVSNWAQT